MTSDETAQTMLEKVRDTKGIVFVYANDYNWMFKDGKLLEYGHSISAEHCLDALGIKWASFGFEDEVAGEIFDNALEKVYRQMSEQKGGLTPRCKEWFEGQFGEGFLEKNWSVSPEDEINQLKEIIQEQKEYIAELQQRNVSMLHEVKMWQEEMNRMEEVPPSQKEIDILLHSLGISQPEQQESYRNFYCSFAGDPLMNLMIHKRLMAPSTVINGGRNQYFVVTDYGKEVAKAHQPKPLSREKKRYQDFLKLREVWYDLTFMEYLKQRLYIGRIE